MCSSDLKMRGWCLGNPKRRKTRYGIKRFVTSWLGKEQDRPSKTRTEKNYGYTIHTDEEYAAGADDLTKVTF